MDASIQAVRRGSRRPRPTLTREALELVAARFRAMGEPLRLHILQELEGGERSVSAIAESVESTQPNVSKHLKILQEAGLVKRRQQGNSALLLDCGCDGIRAVRDDLFAAARPARSAGQRAQGADARLTLMTPATGIDLDGPPRVRPVPMSWRDEFGSANPANLALRLAFPIVACASLLPFVSPGIALMAGIALALTVGNPYPLTTARVITPLLQISVIGLGAGMNLAEVGRAGVHGSSTR